MSEKYQITIDKAQKKFIFDRSNQQIIMKATKLIAIIAFAGLGLSANVAMAQGNDQTEPAPPPITEESATSTEETAPYSETVTIDAASEGTGSGTADAGIAAEPERKERLRVYSGKHEGNNVISDPR